MRPGPIIATPFLALILASAAPAQGPAPLSPAAQAWWHDIEILAADDMEGRLTGSPGYLRAADYVVGRMKALGLEPAGTDGYFQPVGFESQTVDQAGSRATLTGTGGAVTPLTVGADLLVGAGGSARAPHIAAPLVFVGYGLSLPEAGHDDFAGIDLKGKIAVVISGGPQEISGPLKSHARSERVKALARRGAVGMIALTTPKAIEIPWARQVLLARAPGMYLADAKLRDTPDGFFTGSVDPARAELLLAGSGHTFAELTALADASRPLPRFALAQRLSVDVVATRAALTSPNLIARLPGSDPKLKAETIVVSAHLDHLGVGAPIAGDRIYNGAMDDASGIAAMLDIAGRLAKGPRPKRTIVFAAFTAEEKGLLGSHYFAARPSVPKASIVADFNFDMPLPLFPLTSVLAHGWDQSSLGADAKAVGATMGLPLVPDPWPDRNVFIRADQYSFVREGVPSLFFKFGFARGTRESDIEHDWRATRYHSPSDDLNQPGIDREAAVKLDDYVARLVVRVADGPTRPTWNADSFFKRFAR